MNYFGNLLPFSAISQSPFMRFYIANCLALRLAYLAAMELQTQIDELKTSSKRQKIAIIALASVIVAGVGVAAIQPAGDAEFDTITCKKWKVVDKDGKVRIAAGTFADGQASVDWVDKDEKLRIRAATFASGNASVTWFDKDEKLRIVAGTLADGKASVVWADKDCKLRIGAGTLADGKASVTLFDKDGKGRIIAATDANGESSVKWRDKDEKLRISAGTTPDGTVVLPTEDLKPK